MQVSALEILDFRSIAAARIDLGEGVTSVVGPNGAGKTNLVEALDFALSGRSFRTRDRRQLIRFEARLARAEATVAHEDGSIHRLLASVSRSEGRRHLLDGAAAAPSALARAAPPIAVFSPDLLSLVKGPPAERRAHLDAFIAVRWPSRAELRARFGQALAQRNAQIARVAGGSAPASGLDPWDAELAAAAAALIGAREAAVAELGERFAAAADELGLREGTLSYRPRAEGDRAALAAGLRERRDADLALGRSGWGPHLDELQIISAGRALRSYGSQGQQRSALLALLLAERRALFAAGMPLPLMLLDDVMSELDPGHRELLGEQLTAGQALITCADESLLPPSARSRVIRLASSTPLRSLSAA